MKSSSIMLLNLLWLKFCYYYC